MLSDELEACNNTELYQLCKSWGVEAHPGAPRDTLLPYVSGEEEGPQSEHPIDAWRSALMKFVLDHWAVLEPQLTCPAKSKDPRSCFGCVGTQVVTCLVQNKAYEHLIQVHRKG